MAAGVDAFIVLLCLPLIASQRQQELRAVPLLRKPAEATGRITLAEEGLSVLRRFDGNFGIVAAVGPTRTGKSTILGRAFLADDRVNAFEIGGGVTSHTTGAHISDRPIMLDTPQGRLPCFLIDTEGFSGIGGRTSRTYEANLFGLITLISSVVIFNTVFPVDASTVNMLNRFASHAVAVVKELNMHATVVSRRPPSLVWVVQNFNEFNLANSNMSVHEFHDALTASGEASSAEALASATKLLGAPARIMRRGLLANLFAAQTLHPVHRPSPSDEVVANIAAHAVTELSPAYLRDARLLRALAARQVQPAHTCRDASVRAEGARECTTRPLNGAAFVALLERWVALGHISVSEADGGKGRLNATAVLDGYALQLDGWLAWRCREMEGLLEKALRRLGGSPCPIKGCPHLVSKANEKLANLGKAALTHMVDRPEFWRLPGSVAMLTERRVEAASVSCLGTLEARGRRHGLNLTGLLSLTPAPATAPAPPAAATAAAAATERAADVAAAEAPGSAPRGGEVDMQALNIAVIAATDELAATLKAAALKTASTLAARASKGKAKKVPRANRLAKRALAQALKAAGGPCGTSATTEAAHGAKEGAGGTSLASGRKGHGKNKKSKKGARERQQPG